MIFFFILNFKRKKDPVWGFKYILFLFIIHFGEKSLFNKQNLENQRKESIEPALIIKKGPTPINQGEFYLGRRNLPKEFIPPLYLTLVGHYFHGLKFIS